MVVTGLLHSLVCDPVARAAYVVILADVLAADRPLVDYGWSRPRYGLHIEPVARYRLDSIGY